MTVPVPTEPGLAAFGTSLTAFTLAGLLAGRWIGGRIRERLLYRLSGGLFLAFGRLALRQALG